MIGGQKWAPPDVLHGALPLIGSFITMDVETSDLATVIMVGPLLIKGFYEES